MTTTSEKYIETCKRLGFRHEIGFVEIKCGGSIGFTCGKPDEIRALAAAVRREGMKMGKGLRERSENL